MTEQDLFQTGYSAYKAGDKPRAIAALAQLVQQYPRSERGWFLLGLCMDAVDKREYCFQRVLEINPNNADAQKHLAFLSTPRPVVPIQPLQTPKALEQQKHVPAFLPDPETDFEEFQEEAPQSAPQHHTPKKPPQKRKQNTTIIVVSVILGLCILVIGAAISLRMFSNRLVSPAPPLSANNPVATVPVQIEIVPEATSTLLPSTPLPTALPTFAYEPRFEEAPCQFEAPRGVRVTCGYAIVPEDRTSNNGRTIRLAVAIFHSQNSNPKSDPVMFLQGGPGGQAIQFSADAFPVIGAPFISDRDYITYDQRGTGFSDPALVCDELDKVNRQDIYGTIDSSSRELVYQNAFLSCAGLLQTKGINLSAYNTVENAADLNDIVNLLGYEKVNLYGASYGTRLTLVTMRNHPEIVRSAILDSVMPVEINWVNEYPNIANYTLTNLFNACKADADCNKAYPDIETVFWDLAQELDAHPITLSTSAYPMGTVTETIDGSYLLSVVMGLSKTTAFIKTAPQTIYRVKAGDYSTLIAAQYSLPYGLDGINPGLYISVICREHILNTTPENLLAASEELRIANFIWRPFYGNLEKMTSACKTWGTVGPVFGEKDAVVSNIPSLIITGTFDSATPPQFGKQVAEKLTNSYYFEFPNQGHVPTVSDQTGCALQVTLDFLDNPQSEPSRACLSRSPAVDFLVPYTGDPAMKMDREQYNGLTINVPQDWTYVDDGFLRRGSSPFDITQTIAFRASVNVQDLVDYFSSSINGYRGFDGAPIPAGIRQANGYSWTLYYATSNGRPVDIAAAQDGRESLVIVLFSHPDEHDALYRTLFLPMVDSAK